VLWLLFAHPVPHRKEKKEMTSSIVRDGPPSAKRRETIRPAENPLSLKEFLQLVNSEDNKTAIEGLLRFGRCVSSKRAPSLLLEEYLRSSPQCNELFALWKAVPSTEHHIVVETLATVLRHNTSAAMRHLSDPIAREVIRGRLKAIYQLIGDGSLQKVAPAMRLLSAIAKLGPGMAKELFSRINFTLECFSGLAGKRAKRNGSVGPDTDFTHDIRTAWMRFLISLLKVGDTQLI
jgi:hypothetical protein